ncbi:reverse transcriptase [Trichonephila clavipes]|nr:reverse transcriptase [Trichonephila clavipes]
MTKKQVHWMSYELMPRNVERRFSRVNYCFKGRKEYCFRIQSVYHLPLEMTHRAAIQFYSTITTALSSKRLNLINVTSNKADVIHDQLKSCTLETIEQRYPANDGLHIYTEDSYQPPARNNGTGWFCQLFEDSLAVGKNTTNYDGKFLTVCEVTTQLLAAGPNPAKVVLFIDSQAAILPLSSNTPTDCLNTVQFQNQIKIGELISYD